METTAKKNTKLQEARLKARQYVSQDWQIVPEYGTTIEEVLCPEFYTNIAKKFSPTDIIEVVAEDLSWTARLMVVEVGKLWAKVALIYKVDLTADQEVTAVKGDLTNYEVKYRGPHLKFCVVRLSDKSPIKEQCGSKEEAVRWLNDHLKAIAA